MHIGIKKVGTREDVYKGNATRTAGGLKRDDIIEKQFGSKTIYISKKLSDKMRENFNIIKSTNPNYFKRTPKRTIVAPTTLTDSINQLDTTQPHQNGLNNNIQHNIQHKIKQHAKTQKLSFKVKDNTVKNVYYPELKGIDIKELKADLVREEAIEDKGIEQQSIKKEFCIEEVPDIDMMSLE